MVNTNNKFTSDEKNFCEGFYSSKQKNYVLGINLSLAKVRKTAEPGESLILNQINAFDRAEISNMNMGQINMINVSSFCGPKGLIWGLDLCRAPKIKNKWKIQQKGTNIYDIDSLILALKKLLGTVQNARFPLLPGSHVPCASRSFFDVGPSIIYAALALGIPEKREKNAALLMEDVGKISSISVENLFEEEKKISLKLIKSIFEIGENQRYKFSSIFVGVKNLRLESDEIGCGLVACPYFLIAKNACIKNQDLSKMSLSQWDSLVKKIPKKNNIFG